MRLFNQLSACRQMFAYCCMFYVRCKRARTCPHAWMLSLMWQVSNMLKAVITSIFRDHWRIHQGFIHFCLSEWSKWAGRTCHHSSWEVVLFFFNLSCNLQCPPLTGNAVYQLWMTPAEVIYAGLYFPRITLIAWSPVHALFLVFQPTGKFLK